MNLIEVLFSLGVIVAGLFIFKYIFKSLKRKTIYDPGNQNVLIGVPELPGGVAKWKEKPLRFFLVLLGYFGIACLFVVSGIIILLFNLTKS